MDTLILFVGAICMIVLGHVSKQESTVSVGLGLMWIFLASIKQGI